jgi:acyl-CoA thioesterase
MRRVTAIFDDSTIVILSIAVRLVASGFNKALGMPFTRSDRPEMISRVPPESFGENIYLESIL